ncbi:MAG: hypothetical protein ACMG6H_02925 [Acidobacteriota bacterium]
MDYKNAIRNVFTAAAILGAIAVASVMTAAQDKAQAKKAVTAERKSGRDPFKKYEPVVKTGKGSASKLEAPTIQARIDRYRAQKLAAASAHVAPPKPTTALLLSELQVTGIFRTPRGWAAMVEATPIKLSYVIYPGESFFDGQLVAIEETRLVFRHDIVWADGRREKSVEIKPLRQPSAIEAMSSAKSAPTNAPASESEKPAVPEKQ